MHGLVGTQHDVEGPPCAGARDPSDSSFIFDASRPMLPRILEQLREESEENTAPNRPPPTLKMANGLTKTASSPCTFGADGSPLPGQVARQLMQMQMTAEL